MLDAACSINAIAAQQIARKHMIGRPPARMADRSGRRVIWECVSAGRPRRSASGLRCRQWVLLLGQLLAQAIPGSGQYADDEKAKHPDQYFAEHVAPPMWRPSAKDAPPMGLAHLTEVMPMIRLRL